MLIDFQEIIDQKTARIENEFMEILSRFKNQDTIIRINQKLIKLEKISPSIFENACDFIEFKYKKSLSESLPDIVA